MTLKKDWLSSCQAELEQAMLAREKGNEGMARVCARRAAGHVIRRYFEKKGEQPPAIGAFQLLRELSSDPRVPVEIRQVARHFTLPITFEHELPVESDLIAEVRWLARELVGETVP